MNHYDVIIIGSGMGGLLCGQILCKEGLKVGILEKHSIPGGNLQTFTRPATRFDTGVHYLGALDKGQILERYWRYFGLMDHLQLKQLDRDGYDRIGFGESEFPLAQGFDHFQEQLLPYFPKSKGALESYIRMLQDVAKTFPLYNLEHSTNHKESLFTDQSAVRYLSDLLGNHSEHSNGIPLSSIIAGNNFLYAGHTGTPLHIVGLINHSFISSAYRIIGGSDQISKQLVRNIADHGGAILTSHEVVKIEKTSTNFIITTSEKEIFEASRLISAIHPASILKLFPETVFRPAFYQRISNLANTPSVFILYLKLKPETFPYLNYNYYHHAKPDVWKESDALDSQWPSMYLFTTPCHRPEQKFAETVTILTYMQPDNVKAWKDTTTGKRGYDYQAFKMENAKRVLTLVGKKFPSLEASIEWLETATPLTYRDYTGTPDGALYGIRKDYKDHLNTTILPKTKLPGFYFTGQNINMHGVLGVTIGSVLTCSEILGLPYLLNKIANGS